MQSRTQTADAKPCARVIRGDSVTRKEISEKLAPVFKRYPIKRAALFGSYARDDYTADSDVDIVVEFVVQSPGLMFFSLLGELSETIGLPVDLIWESGLRHMDDSFRLMLDKEGVLLYEADAQ